ncbi:MAG: hypothetical protein ACI9SX_001469, partial [Pseudoalteromonas tetraodonis]
TNKTQRAVNNFNISNLRLRQNSFIALTPIK